jgi:hypothetical protein
MLFDDKNIGFMTFESHEGGIDEREFGAFVQLHMDNPIVQIWRQNLEIWSRTLTTCFLGEGTPYLFTKWS